MTRSTSKPTTMHQRLLHIGTSTLLFALCFGSLPSCTQTTDPEAAHATTDTTVAGRMEQALVAWAGSDKGKLATLSLDQFRAVPEHIHRYVYDQCAAERKLALWQEKLDREIASGTWSAAQNAHITNLKALLQLAHFQQSWDQLPEPYTNWLQQAGSDLDDNAIERIAGTLLAAPPIPSPATTEGGGAGPRPMIMNCTCSPSIWSTFCSAKNCITFASCGQTKTGCGFLGLGSCTGLCVG